MKRSVLIPALVAGISLAGASFATAFAADPSTSGQGAPGQGAPGQGAPGQGAPDQGPLPGHGPGPMMPPGGWPHGGPGMMMWHHHDDKFSLFAQVKNKALTLADVKIIAQAILLEHGNHDWKVTNVTSADNLIDFSFATAHGDVVATFSVDPASGRMKRVS
jgi:hypothetical protein